MAPTPRVNYGSSQRGRCAVVKRHLTKINPSTLLPILNNELPKWVCSGLVYTRVQLFPVKSGETLIDQQQNYTICESLHMSECAVLVRPFKRKEHSIYFSRLSRVFHAISPSMSSTYPKTKNQEDIKHKILGECRFRLDSAYLESQISKFFCGNI